MIPSVVTNFLSVNDAKSVELSFLTASADWGFASGTASRTVKTPEGLVKQDTFQFVRYLDKTHWVVELLTKVFEEKTGYKVTGLVRAKSNLTFPTPGYPDNAVCPLHVDVQENSNNIITAVYYVNESDGELVFFNSDNNKRAESFRVSPVRNSLVYFPANVFHAKRPPKEYPIRCVVNLNFYI